MASSNSTIVQSSIDPTVMSPAEWHQYFLNARVALHQNPRDVEALQAVRDAQTALSAYNQAEAATPGERIRAGVSGGISGLGQAVADIPMGVANVFMHPIQTLQSLPQVPGALAQGISSDNPETVARTVGNIGSLLLPGAEASGAVRLPFIRGNPVVGFAVDNPVRVAPSVGAVVAKAVLSPLRAARAVVENPILSNQIKRLQLQRLQEGLPPEDIPGEPATATGAAPVAPRSPAPAAPAMHPEEVRIRTTLTEQGFGPQDIERAVGIARQRGQLGQAPVETPTQVPPQQAPATQRTTRPAPAPRPNPQAEYDRVLRETGSPGLAHRAGRMTSGDPQWMPNRAEQVVEGTLRAPEVDAAITEGRAIQAIREATPVTPGPVEMPRMLQPRGFNPHNPDDAARAAYDYAVAHGLDPRAAAATAGGRMRAAAAQSAPQAVGFDIAHLAQQAPTSQNYAAMQDALNRLPLGQRAELIGRLSPEWRAVLGY